MKLIKYRRSFERISLFLRLLAVAGCSDPTVPDDTSSEGRDTHGLNGNFFNFSYPPNDIGCDAYFESACTYRYVSVDSGLARSIENFHTVVYYNRANDPYQPGSKVVISVNDSVLVPYGSQGIPALVSRSVQPFPGVLRWDIIGDTDIQSFQTSIETPAPLIIDTLFTRKHDSISASAPGSIRFHGGTDSVSGKIQYLFTVVHGHDTSLSSGGLFQYFPSIPNTGSVVLPHVEIPSGAIDCMLLFDASSMIGKILHVGTRTILVRSAASLSVVLPVALDR